LALSEKLTFFLVAGEASGDLHGAHLIKELKKQYPRSTFVGHGGDKMVQEGLELVEHIRNLSVMGFVEVLRHLPFLSGVMKNTLEKIRTLKPDRIILIDYPGFNLRLAKKCKDYKIPITYFILPQLWAWKEGRINIFKKYIEQSLCIFPFEQDWFEARGVPANFVGHPFSELSELNIDSNVFFKKHGLQKGQPILTLLPGSRQQEIDLHWPIFLETAAILKKRIPKLAFVLGRAREINFHSIPDFILQEQDVRLAMVSATAALTASGTASLECAVLDTPEVVCYKMAAISGFVAKKLNKAPFAAMVNLIAQRQIVPEFLQNDMTASNLADALLPLLKSTSHRKNMLSDYSQIRRTLGLPGVYSRAAQAIIGKTING